MSTRCIIATRKSALALWQARAVADAIRAAVPDVEPEFCLFTTKGDTNLSTPLSLIGDKGLFVEELEEALAEGLVDICVHSVKDMPAKLREGCVLAACLPRARANDVLVLPEGGECPDVEAFL
ncbi:MAG: hypothetical protein IKD70_03320, partial [Eggerthellaceae bacterium]|nr:hypothetical protein [Eggerthellaceae bacterium]